MKESFNYNKSVRKVRAIANRLKRMTTDMVRELLLAKKFITSQKKRKNESPSWNDYCSEIGIYYKIADLLLRKFSLNGFPEGNPKKHITTKRRGK
jgi:hypothetical protein